MQTDRRSLSDRLAAFPRLGLANLPTPLEPMKRLTAHLGGPRLWVKREDATGLGFDAEPARVRADVVAFAREASDLLDVPFDEETVEVVAGHAGPAYGVPHEATIEAIRLAGRLEALPLDPVYSGKALAGLIALIRQGRWRKDEDVVFLHTGGAPALFAYQSALGI